MIEAIDRIIEGEQGETPGLALAVVRDGQLFHLRGYGVTGVEDVNLPISPDTLFCIGSTSKVLTGTTVMRLVEAGLLSLDAPVSHYVPWLRLAQPGAEHAITLRHLLSHTSGLGSAYTDYGPRDPTGLEAFVREELPRISFVAPPGAVHFYSNAGIDLAGYIAEAASGVFFPLLVRDQLFAPLGMRRSTYDRNVAITYPLALPHELGPDGRLRVEHRLVDNVPGNPAGFALSTARDLASLALMFLNGGGVGGEAFLRADSIREMWRPHANLYSLGSGRSYGLTFYTQMRYKGLRLTQHGGSMMSYSCRFMLVPAAQTAIVILTNWGDTSWSMGKNLLDLLLGLPTGPAYPPPPRVEPDRAGWGAYIGHYLNVEEGLAEIALSDDGLVLRRNQGDPLALEAVEGGYASESLQVAFIDGPGGSVELLIIDEQPYRRLGEPLPAQEPASHELERYAGTYASTSELQGSFYPITFFVEGGRLYARQGEHQAPYTSLGDGRFVGPYGLAQFEESGVRLYGSLLKRRI